MLSGVYTHKHKVYRNGPTVKSEVYGPAVSTLKDAGYKLGYFGKNHSGMDLASAGFEGYFPPSYGNPYLTQEYRDYLNRKNMPDPIFHAEWSHGKNFEAGKEYNLTQTDCFNHAVCGYFTTPEPFHEIDFLLDMAHGWLGQNAQNPFVLRVDAWGPHQAYQIPLGFKDTIINEADIEPYPGFNEDSLTYKPQFTNRYLERMRERGGVIKNWEYWQPVLKRAYENYSYIDMRIGSLLDALDRLGLAENTAILLTADHGDAIASHGGMFDKCGDMAEEVMDIPMLLSAPGLPHGVINNSLTSNLDAMPTVLDLAGVAEPHAMDGISLKQVALGSGKRESLLCEHYGHLDNYYNQRAVYKGDWKYVETENEVDQLYNLRTDPYELQNFAYENPTVLAEMKNTLTNMKGDTK